MFSRIGSWCFRRRRVVAAAWLGLIVVVFALAGAIGSAFDSSFSIPASESADGFDVLDEYFGGQGSGFTGSIVFEADQGVGDPEVRAAMEALFARADAIEGVRVTSPYSEEGAGQVSRQGDTAGRIAFATVGLAEDIDQVESAEIGAELAEARPDVDGLRVEIGGAALAEFEPPESELIGLSFAIVVLIVSFGSVLAMGLPVGVAVAGVSSGIALSTLISNITTMPDFATTIGAMIGLGVGIDYALFIVTRYREGTARGLDPERATEVAMDTAGRAVLFAGVTVVVSLLGMLLIGLEFVSGLGIGAAMTVAITMVASLTLLPALIGFAGPRVEVTRWRGLIAAGLVAVALLGVGLGVQPLLVGAPLAAIVLLAGFAVAPLRREVPTRARRPLRETFWYRWSRVVQRHPWAAVALGAGILVVLALPVLGLRLGFSDESNYAESTTTRQAYELLVEGFGAGFNGPFLVAAELGSPGDAAALPALVEAIGATDGVASVSPARPDDPTAPAAAVIQVVPETSPQDEATQQLVERLRGQVIPSVTDGTTLDVSVTGMVPANIDFTDYLAGRIVLFFGVVLALSFLLLMVVFRSLLVPLKAVIMNVLSIASAYGVVVAIFQWGWFSGLLGLGDGAPIEPFIPMMLFAIVFGLSMDYEVFLLSRIKEEYDRTGDPVGSVADGLAATARVISAAAAIMVVVFGSFVFEDDRIVKLFGVGLGMAVLLDATLVRMLLVPATMELLGERNWWLPGWLDRILPRIDVEGSAHAGDDQPPPSPGAPDPDPEPVLTG